MEIYVGRNGEQWGPYSLEQVHEYLAGGKLLLTDSAWHNGLDHWIPLSEVSGVLVRSNAPKTPAPKIKHAHRFKLKQQRERRRPYLVPILCIAFGAILAVSGIYFVVQQSQPTSARVRPSKQQESDPASVTLLAEARPVAPDAEFVGYSIQTEFPVGRVFWSPDGSKLAMVGIFSFPIGESAGKPGSVHSDFEIKLWDAFRGRAIQKLKGHQGYVAKLAWAPDGSRLVTYSYSRIRILAVSDQRGSVWDASTGLEICSFEHIGLAALAWSADGKNILSCSNGKKWHPDNSVRVWDASDGEEIDKFEGHEGAFSGANWSPDRTKLATYKEKTVFVWDILRRQKIATLEGHEGKVEEVSWSPDGLRLASRSGDQSVFDKNFPTRVAIEVVTGVKMNIGYAIKIWDVGGGREIQTLKGDDKRETDMAWSPDGSRLVSFSQDKTMRVWDTATGEEILTLSTGHQDYISEIAWNPQGTKVASLSHFEIKIWDVSSGNTQPVFSREQESAYRFTCMAWSPVGSKLAFGSEDRTVKVLPIPN